jgi:hypothetical protein
MDDQFRLAIALLVAVHVTPPLGNGNNIEVASRKSGANRKELPCHFMSTTLRPKEILAFEGALSRKCRGVGKSAHSVAQFTLRAEGS